MTLMKHKGYSGLAEVDTDAKVIRGQVMGLLDVVTFEGETVAEAEQAFRDSVDDYLAFCSELGRSPEKPYSGTLNARLGVELHRKLAILAMTDSVSINEKLRQITEGAIKERLGDLSVSDVNVAIPQKTNTKSKRFPPSQARIRGKAGQTRQNTSKSPGSKRAVEK